MTLGSIKEWSDSKIDGITKLRNNSFNNQKECSIKKFFSKIREIPTGTIYILSRLGYNPITQTY